MVAGSGVCAKRIVVDVWHHMLGRLSSNVAKELLNDQKVVIVLSARRSASPRV
jgi:large subunit ribosomal protein L13Ae